MNEHGLALPRVRLELVPVSPDGRIGRPRRIRANSWLKNMALMVRSTLAETQSTGGKDTAGAARTIHHGAGYTVRYQVGAVGGNTRGIQAGTGDTPVDRDDFQMAALVGHGNGDNLLFYNLQAFNGPVAIAGGYRWTLQRQLDNNGSVPITVREVGLVFQHNTTGAANENYPFLVLRDLVAGGHAVPAGGSVAVRYHLDWEV